MKKTDLERMRKMISLWESLSTQIRLRGITREILLEDTFAQWAVTTPLYNIGEQVYALSSELKDSYPEIPWSLVSGLRHRLVHDYEGVNWTIIAEVVFGEMDTFIESVRRVVAEKE